MSNTIRSLFFINLDRMNAYRKKIFRGSFFTQSKCQMMIECKYLINLKYLKKIHKFAIKIELCPTLNNIFQFIG